MADPIDLTELDVITTWSLAVRSATAERADLIAALRSDLEWLEAGRAKDPRVKKATSSKSLMTKSTASAAKRPASARGRRAAGS